MSENYDTDITETQNEKDTKSKGEDNSKKLREFRHKVKEQKELFYNKIRYAACMKDNYRHPCTLVIDGRYVTAGDLLEDPNVPYRKSKVYVKLKAANGSGSDNGTSHLYFYVNMTTNGTKQEVPVMRFITNPRHFNSEEGSLEDNTMRNKVMKKLEKLTNLICHKTFGSISFSMNRVNTLDSPGTQSSVFASVVPVTVCPAKDDELFLAYDDRTRIIFVETHLYHDLRKHVEDGTVPSSMRYSVLLDDSNAKAYASDSFVAEYHTTDATLCNQLLREFVLMSYNNYLQIAYESRFINALFKTAENSFYKIQNTFIPVVMEYSYLFNPLTDRGKRNPYRTHKTVRDTVLYHAALYNQRVLKPSGKIAAPSVIISDYFERIDAYLSSSGEAHLCAPILSHAEICALLGMKTFMRFTPSFLYRFLAAALDPELAMHPAFSRYPTDGVAYYHIGSNNREFFCSSYKALGLCMFHQNEELLDRNINMWNSYYSLEEIVSRIQKSSFVLEDLDPDYLSYKHEIEMILSELSTFHEKPAGVLKDDRYLNSITIGLYTFDNIERAAVVLQKLGDDYSSLYENSETEETASAVERRTLRLKTNTESQIFFHKSLIKYLSMFVNKHSTLYSVVHMKSEIDRLIAYGNKGESATNKARNNGVELDFYSYLKDAVVRFVNVEQNLSEAKNLSTESKDSPAS